MTLAFLERLDNLEHRLELLEALIIKSSKASLKANPVPNPVPGRPENYMKPWTSEQYDILFELVQVKSTVQDIADEMKRSVSSIKSAFKKKVLSDSDSSSVMSFKEIKEQYNVKCIELLYY